MPDGLSRAPRRSRFTTLLLVAITAAMVLPAAAAPQTVHAFSGPTPTVSSLSPEAGPTTGGTTVTITGSNFDPTLANDSVSFGSVLGTVVSVNVGGTQLTVTTPSGMAEGQVQVTVTTTAGGPSLPGVPATLTTFQFTNPGPFVPLNANICDNQPDGNTTPCAAHGPLSNAANQNSMNVQVTGEYNIPVSGVAAVAVELFTAPTGAGASTSFGNVSVYPTGLAGGASDLSWVNGNNGTLLIEIPVSPQVQVAGQWTGGQITVSNSTTSSASINLILDVEGYIADSQTNASGLINALPSSTTICSTGDSRSPCYIAGSAGLASGHWLQFPVLGLGGVPPATQSDPTGGVSAVVLNIQTYAENGPGWGVAYADGQPMPSGLASALWNAGTPMTTHIIVPVDSTGKIAFYNGGPGATQVSVAVDGWFTDNSTPLPPGGSYNPNNGTLICDTIANTYTPCSGGGQLGTAIGNHDPLSVQVTGQGGVPPNSSSISGVELQVTVTNVSGLSNGQGTYVCVYPDGGSCQDAELNLYGGVPANLLVIVPLGPDGKVDVYTPTGSMDVLIAVTGYYTPGWEVVQTASRTDPPPYKGGMELHDKSYECTAGLVGYRVVYDQQNNDWVNLYQMMTAGHCFGETDTVMHSVSGQKDATLGQVSSNAFGNGSSADAAMVDINGSYTLATNDVITSQPNQNAVTSRASAQPNFGDGVCFSGIDTGEVCGPVTANHMTISSINPFTEVRTQMTDMVIANGQMGAGDSGAPVYSSPSNAPGGLVAQGIAQGYLAHDDGTPYYPPEYAFSFIGNILTALQGVCLATSAPFNPNPRGPKC